MRAGATAGCAVDNVGNPTRDPRWLMQEPLGALLAFGAHKGSGLALICSLLGAALTGGETESARPRRARHHQQYAVDRLRPVPARRGEHYTAAVADMLAWTRTSRDDDGLLLPGEAEQRRGNFACSTVSKSMRSAGSSSKRWKAPCLRRILEITTSVIRRAR